MTVDVTILELEGEGNGSVVVVEGNLTVVLSGFEGRRVVSVVNTVMMIVMSHF